MNNSSLRLGGRRPREVKQPTNLYLITQSLGEGVHFFASSKGKQLPPQDCFMVTFLDLDRHPLLAEQEPVAVLHFPHAPHAVMVQSLLQHDPLHVSDCSRLGQAAPLQEAAVVTLLVLDRDPDFSHSALQAPHEPQFDVTQLTGQHLPVLHD